jgi:hypothetical protein
MNPALQSPNCTAGRIRDILVAPLFKRYRAKRILLNLRQALKSEVEFAKVSLIVLRRGRSDLLHLVEIVILALTADIGNELVGH